MLTCDERLTPSRYTRAHAPADAIGFRTGTRAHGRVRVPHAAADLEAAERAHRVRCPSQGRDVPARRLVQDSRTDEQVLLSDGCSETTRRRLLLRRQPCAR